jgi:hypothetical protein
MPSPSLIDAPGLLLTGEENFRLTTFGSLAAAVVALEGRVVTPDNCVVPLLETQVPNSDRSAKVSIYPAGVGMLTNVQLRVSTGTAISGHVFAILEIGRGREGGFQPLATLIQGYITSAARRVWPGSTIDASTAGQGRPRTITGTDPAANTEISETVPTGARWKIGAISFALVTDANVATRSALLTIDDGATIIWQSGISTGQAASLTGIYRYAPGAASTTIGTNHFNFALPANLILVAGSRIRTVTGSLQVGDNYGAPVLHVEEFLE